MSRTSHEAFDVEFYRQPVGWYWAVYGTGTTVLFAKGRSRCRLVARLQLIRTLRRLTRATDAA